MLTQIEMEPWIFPLTVSFQCTTMPEISQVTVEQHILRQIINSSSPSLQL